MTNGEYTPQGTFAMDLNALALRCSLAVNFSYNQKELQAHPLRIKFLSLYIIFEQPDYHGNPKRGRIRERLDKNIDGQ